MGRRSVADEKTGICVDRWPLEKYIQRMDLDKGTLGKKVDKASLRRGFFSLYSSRQGLLLQAQLNHRQVLLQQFEHCERQY